MSDVLDNLKKNVLGKMFTKTETIDSKTYKALSNEEKRAYEMSGDDYYRKVPIDISEEEEQRIINLKMLQFMEKTQSNISTIAGIMIFWLVLSMIGLFWSLISLANR